MKGIHFPWPIAEIVWQHHERLDGSGYPRGLKGDKITLEAKILAVADTVDAISSYRPYRAALGINAALDEIREFSGVLFDPEVVNACQKLFLEKKIDLYRNVPGVQQRSVSDEDVVSKSLDVNVQVLPPSEE